MAHELGHALDFKVKNKLFDSKTIQDAYVKMNKDEIYRNRRGYYSKKVEVVARMIEQYVAEAK
jgi:hypothetical protein